MPFLYASLQCECLWSHRVTLLTADGPGNINALQCLSGAWRLRAGRGRGGGGIVASMKRF